MKIDETNEFSIPLTDHARIAFAEKLEETIKGRTCLLLEWANGDNLMVNDTDDELLEFAFYSGDTQIWKISESHARELAASIGDDKSDDCEAIKAQCALRATRAQSAAAGAGPSRREAALKCA